MSLSFVDVFFFFKQKTAYEMRISDWSSDVCSSDLEGFDLAIRHAGSVPETHVAWLLRPSSTLLVAAPSYLAEYGTPKAPGDLSHHNCLYYLRSAASPAWRFAPARREGERPSVAVRGHFCAKNREALREDVDRKSVL